MTTKLQPTGFGYGSLTSATIVDSFNFTLNTPTVENFSFTSNGSISNTGWAYRITIYDSASQLVGENFSWANTTFSQGGYYYAPNFNLGLSAGTYTVNIQAYSAGAYSGGLGVYDIYLSQTTNSIQNYSLSQNHTQANATQLTAGTYMYGQLDYTSAVDYYKVTLNSQGGEFYFGAPNNNNGTSYKVTLLDSSGSQIYSNTTTTSLDLVNASLAAGTYYASITGNTGYNGNNYSLLVNQFTNTVTPAVASVITTPGHTVNISSLFNLNSSGTHPLYLDLTMTDRNEYPHDQTPIFGDFQANGVVAPVYHKSVLSYFTLTYQYIDESAILFTYQSSSGRYYNQTYGYFDQVKFVTGSLNYENAEISVFSSNNLNFLQEIDPNTANGSSLYDTQFLADAAAKNSFLQYNGSVSIENNASVSAAFLNHATPFGIVSAAQTYVGQIWDNNGCWVLVSDIASQAGSSIPATSLQLYSTPAANGEWIPVYFGGSQSNPTVSAAESILRPGDVVTVAWGGNRGGHIFTVVSGYGSNALTIDNSGPAPNNGISTDVVINPAHSVHAELVNGAAVASSITVYRLDTPTITVNSINNNITAGQTLNLAPLFSTTDAGGLGSLPITSYAFYDLGAGGGANDSFLVNGVTSTAHAGGSSALVISASSLSNIQLQTAGATSGGTDTVYVSAFNGSYWGDWAQIGVNITAPINNSSTVTLSSNQTYTPQINQSIIGSSGTESILYNKTSVNFTLTVSGSSTIVTDQSGVYGTNKLTNVERLQFTDTMVALDIGPTQNAGSVYMLYQATFNRTPDAGGLGYWINAVDKGANIITNVASFFVTSSEFVAKYGANPTNASYVDNLYQNVLHRAGDAGGITYWNTQLNSGAVTKAYVLEQFATLAEGAANVAPTIAHGIAYTQWVG